MAVDQEYRMVEFQKYCETCEHKAGSENDENSPCWHCLEEPINLYSEKPVNYKEKD